MPVCLLINMNMSYHARWNAEMHIQSTPITIHLFVQLVVYLPHTCAELAIYSSWATKPPSASQPKMQSKSSPITSPVVLLYELHLTSSSENDHNRSTKFDVYTVWDQKVPTKDFCVCVCHIAMFLATSDTLSLRFSSLKNKTSLTHETMSVRV